MPKDKVSSVMDVSPGDVITKGGIAADEFTVVDKTDPQPSDDPFSSDIVGSVEVAGPGGIRELEGNAIEGMEIQEQKDEMGAKLDDLGFL